jgi:hypothetical protein
VVEHDVVGETPNLGAADVRRGDRHQIRPQARGPLCPLKVRAAATVTGTDGRFPFLCPNQDAGVAGPHTGRRRAMRHRRRKCGPSDGRNGVRGTPGRGAAFGASWGHWWSKPTRTA